MRFLTAKIKTDTNQKECPHIRRATPTMKSVLALIILACIPLNTFAVGIVEGATVTQVRVDKSGAGYVVFDKPLYDTPANCTQSGYKNVLAFDTNEAGGKAILSIVLAAQASGKKVTAVGTGTCPIYGVMEAWSWGTINS